MHVAGVLRTVHWRKNAGRQLLPRRKLQKDNSQEKTEKQTTAKTKTQREGNQGTRPLKWCLTARGGGLRLVHSEGLE